ncbi:MAG: DUF1080 domain-containing protein [Acidobacteriota bacterium]
MNRNYSVLLPAAVSIAAFITMAGMAQSPPQGKAANKKGAANESPLGYEDTPMLPGLPYRVHDIKRPHPRVVTPGNQPGAAPSDAIVLFSGSDLSRWRAAGPGTNGGIAATAAPASWKVEDGYLEATPGKGDIATAEAFGDIQLHLEWRPPADAHGDSQNRGNSGIKFQGRYELQVLDSYQNPTYADGQAGAIYGEWPPLVNAVHRPGEWNYYDAVFEAPRFEGDKLVKPAYITVFLNGVVLHNRKEIMGITAHRQFPKYQPQAAEEPLVLQNHNGSERFRNIWVRRLAGYDQPEK